MSDVSKSLRALTKNEQMSESLVFLSKSFIRSFFAKNKRFAQKPTERISSPGHEYGGWGEVANSGCGRGKYIGECGEGVGGGGWRGMGVWRCC